MLVPAVARGDDAALAELFRLYGEAVLRFVYRRVGESMEDAEEITLDTFASAAKLAGTFDIRSQVLTWLCGIAKLRIIDHFRRTSREKRMPARLRTDLGELEKVGACGLDHVLDRIDAERIVDEMLADLTDGEREVLLLRYVDQLSVREIATIVNRSEKGVEGLLTRAKNKPKARVQHWFEGGSR